MSISKKRLDELMSIKDEDIDYSDIPELDEAFWKNAELVMPDTKVPVSLRLDQKVVDWFKKQGKGYQSKINAVLSAYVRLQKSE
jgi:uncharacterized protein (DUF4415 family)